MLKLFKSFITEYKIAIIALLVIAVFRSLFFNAYIVPSGSMYPNLKVGQLIFTNRITLGIKIPFSDTYFYMWKLAKRGDVVVAKEPGSGTTIVKRVIAISGDTISLKDGQLIRNNEIAKYIPADTLQQPDFKFKTLGYKEEWKDGSYEYINKSIEKLPYDTKQTWSEVRVPEGKVLLMGDNRDNSKDGRWFGFVDQENLYGIVINGNRYD